MKNYDSDETFLGRWIAGELSDEELAHFKKTETYRQYKLINEESQHLRGPEIDVETALKNVKQNIKYETTKAKVLNLWQIAGAAAILVLLLGFYLNSSKTITSNIGGTQTIVLEDGSTIDLNANSSISYKRFFWSKDKTVILKGEAYFTVSKGDDFKVETSKGTVKVLGTKFNIKDRTNFELKCYEGKVGFSLKNKKSPNEILTKGMQFNIESNETKKLTFNEDIPSWREGISKFNERPLYLVLEELTHYFDIDFDTTDIDTDRLFSGSFNHSDLDLALKATLVPMGIKYRLEQNVCILSE